MVINNHSVSNRDPIPTHYEDVPANWHEIAGQRFSIGARHIHVGGNEFSGYARVARSLCAVNSGGVTTIPEVPLDAAALSVMAHHGILVEEVGPGVYRAAVPLHFESYYRIALGRQRGGERYD